MSDFKGFPKELFTFFKQLKKNNTKEWFESHRADYEAYVKEPASAFVLSMGEKLKEIAPGIHAIPKTNQSLFRINRDTRFSKDKRPYKTNLGVWLWEGNRKRMECSGFYFHVEEEGLMLGAGIHAFSKDLLDRYREAVAVEKIGSALSKIMKKIEKHGYVIGGKHYKKVPRGYNPSYPFAELLLYNGLTAMIETDIPGEFYTSAIVDYTFAYFKKMSPLHTWLLEAID